VLSGLLVFLNRPQFQSGIRLAFWLFLLLLVLFTAYRYREKTEKPSRLGTQTRTAILRWKDQVQNLMKGQNVYPAGNPYPNPPIMGIILSPLYEIPPNQTALLWFGIKLILAAISLYWTAKLLHVSNAPVPDVVIGLTILLSLHPILGDLSHGNVNIFIAFLVLGTLAAYHHGWDWLAGLVLALAIACKITPLLFVVYFGWKWILTLVQRFREDVGLMAAIMNPGLKVLLATGLGLLLWFIIVPGITLGWAHNLQLLESWYSGMVRPFVIEGKITSEHANQSLPGFLVRMLTNQPSSLDYDEDDRPIATEFHNITDIGPDAVRWIIRVCQVLFVLGLMRWCLVPVAALQTRRVGLHFVAECSYIILGMLLFSERTWKHHGVVLMVPYVVLAQLAITNRSDRVQIASRVILVLATLLTLIPSLLSGEYQDQILAYGSHTAIFLILLVGVVMALKSTPNSTSSTAKE
jgi:alpha-1,2-mannosyltransferase